MRVLPLATPRRRAYTGAAASAGPWSARRGDVQPGLDRLARAADRPCVAVGHELGVGQEQEGLDLERQLGGVLLRADRALTLGVAGRRLEDADPGVEDLHHPVA